MIINLSPIIKNLSLIDATNDNYGVPLNITFAFLLMLISFQTTSTTLFKQRDLDGKRNYQFKPDLYSIRLEKAFGVTSQMV